MLSRLGLILNEIDTIEKQYYLEFIASLTTRFCKNFANSQKLNVTKLQSHCVSGYGENEKSKGGVWEWG